MNSDLLDDSKKWENFVNWNKIIFGCLYITLLSSYNMNSDLLDGSKKWENFVNGNKIIFGCANFKEIWSKTAKTPQQSFIPESTGGH